MAKRVKCENWCLMCAEKYVSAHKPVSRWRIWKEGDPSFKIREVTHACPKCGFVHKINEVIKKDQ